MKYYVFFISIFVLLLYVSCSNNTEKDSAQMFKFHNEMFYFYDDEHSDSLVCGLRAINKVTHVYENRSESFVEFLIEDPDITTEKPCQRAVLMDSEEISVFNSFLDSCINSQLEDNYSWKVKMKSGVVFDYANYDKSINFSCGQGHWVVLQITPKRLKEILVRAKMTD